MGARIRRPGLPRPRAVLCLVPIALAGCRSVHRGTEGVANQPADASAAANGRATTPQVIPPMSSRSDGRRKGDSNVAQAEFLRKPTPEQSYNVHMDMGRLQEGQENLELALVEYQRALDECEGQHRGHLGGKKASQRALVHRRIGSVLDRLGQFDQSKDHYRTALKLSPNDPKVWNDAGYSYYLQGRWADAERALKTAERIDPKDTRILTNLGLTLAASGKPDEALAAFTRAGGPAVGHANLAYILAASGQLERAQQHYRTALRHQPDLALATQALAALDVQVAQRSAQLATSRAQDPASLLLATAPDVPLPTLPALPPPSPTVPVERPSIPMPVTLTTARRPPSSRTPTAPGRPPSVAATVPRDPGVNRAKLSQPGASPSTPAGLQPQN